MLASSSDAPISAQPGRTNPLRLIDLCAWPRAGLKGSAATAWLQARGTTLPEVHRAARQGDGSLLLRLAQNEFVALAGAANTVHPAGLPEFSLGGENDPGLCPVPRFAANSWFAIVGDSAAELLAKICGLDLRPNRFADHTVAQTIVARISTVVARDDAAGQLRYHLLIDRTMSAYFFDVLRDAMTEFDGVVSRGG
jgi:sarcosine oxidase subunit gamma